MNRTEKENKRDVIIFFIELILTVILCTGILLILYYPYISEKYFSKIKDNDSACIATTEQFVSKKSVDYSTDKSIYNILPGYTYYEDKGNMKLFADIIHTGDNTLMVSAVLYHIENFKDILMKDATIKEVFYLQENDSYKNKDNTITIQLNDNLAEFKDNRVTVTMPYNGILELVPTPVENTEILDMESGELVKDELSIGESKVESVVIDSYDLSSVPDNYISGKDFTKYLISDNEKKDFTFTAKYIETCTNAGVKYQELYTGTYFYSFGSEFPYDSKVCNTVTITATYRGYNKRFNGLSMNDSYPCFVTKSIRKPNKQEVNP